MNIKLWCAVLGLASTVYATEFSSQMSFIVKGGYTDWQRYRDRGVDLVGVAKLIRFDPAKTNSEGVEATFLFTNVMKGLSGEYVLTIPYEMRDPMNMPYDLAKWSKDGVSSSWKWKESDSYGCLCLTNFNHGIHRVEWVIPLDRWNAFQANVRKERSEFEVFVKEKKMKLMALDKRREDVLRRNDIEDEERKERMGQLDEQGNEIMSEVENRGEQYWILHFNWEQLDETWP